MKHKHNGCLMGIMHSAYFISKTGRSNEARREFPDLAGPH